MAEIVLTPLDNGPNLIKGPVKIVDAEGQVWEVKKETVALCRCGGSASRPFCEGTHGKIRFSAVNRAPRKA